MASTLTNKMTCLTLFPNPTTWVSYLWTPIVAMASWIQFILIVQPLERFYLYGPRVLGCWEGKPLEDICVSLAPRSRADFWMDHPGECLAMVDKHLYGWSLVVQYIVGVVVVWTLIKCAYTWWWRRSMLRDLETVLSQLHKVHHASSLSPRIAN